MQSRAWITLFCLILVALAASSACAQPIKLLKDLRPGLVPDDKRTILQAVETGNSLYVVSERHGYSGIGDYYLNSITGNGVEQKIGFNLGNGSRFGNGQFCPSAFPFFAVQNGKAIFSGNPKGHGFQFYEHDAQSGRLKQLSSEGSTNGAFATWIGTGGRVCFLRRSQDLSTLEIGHLDSATSTGILITKTLPFESTDPISITSWLEDAQVVDTRLVFSAVENEGLSLRIIATDGTSTGTSELLRTSGSSYPSASLVSALGKCFFTVSRNDSTACPLYRTDGTVTGTIVIDETIPQLLRPQKAADIAESTTTLFWLTQDQEDVLFTNGSTTGLLSKEPVADLRYDSVVWIGNTLYISAHQFSDYRNRVLLVSDGITTPVQLNSTNSPFSQIFAEHKTTTGSLVLADSGVYFVAAATLQDQLLAQYDSDALPARPNVWSFQGKSVYPLRDQQNLTDQLWLSNPTSLENPQLLSRFTRTPQSSNPNNYEAAAGLLFFSNPNPEEASYAGELYRTDGTSAGTRTVLPADPVFLGPTPAGLLYYHKSQASDGSYWGDGKVKVDNGSGQIPMELIDASYAYPEVPPVRLFTIGNFSYIGGKGFMGEPTLIKTDGTQLGTTLLPIGGNSGLEYPLHPIGVVGSRGLFSVRATATSGSIYQIWSTDGTEMGTTIIGESTTKPSEGAGFREGRFVYAASDQAGQTKLFITDGSTSGTSQIPTTESFPSARKLISNGWMILFFADQPLTAIPRIWCLDNNLEVYTHEAYNRFADNENLHAMASETAIYVAGNTSESILEIAEFREGRPSMIGGGFASGRPRLLAASGIKLYFTQMRPKTGRELWTYDTLSQQESQDFAPGPASGISADTAIVFNNKLIFSADPQDGVTGQEPHYIDLQASTVGDWDLY